MGEIIKINDETKEGGTSFDMLASLMPELEGIEAFAALLEMSDEDFEHMKPIMLEELEKGFNNSNDKYNLALAFNMSGKSAHELDVMFRQVIDNIDTEFGKYNESKRGFLKQVIGMLVNSIETGKGLHNRIIRIPIELVHPDAKLPTYAHEGDAGCDVYCLDDYTLEPGSTTLIPLGFKVAIPAGYELQMRPRSGTSLRTKMRVSNAPGTIDSNYRGEVGVIFDNIGDNTFYFAKGQRVAQMVLNEVPVGSFYQVANINDFASDRGAGGFGSSGV